MPQDTRLARLLHVLIHMHLRGGSTTSDTISEMLKTNPVVVRRTMAGLRDAGYVVSVGGRGGGWTLTEEFAQLTVADVYRATRGEQVFAFGPSSDNPQCPVEATANRLLETAMEAAETSLLAHLSSKTLVEIAREIV